MRIVIHTVLAAGLLGAVLLAAQPEPAPKPPRRPVGMCQPYAEKCLYCSDCSQCGHCAVKGGKCSVCWNR